jgi:hypothetical protein
MKTTIYILVLSFLTACSNNNDANDSQDSLPSITQIGANTAGCIINGKILIPKNGNQAIGGPPIYGMNVNAGINFSEPIIGDDYWQLEIANKKDPNSAGIVLWIKDMQQGIGNYPVNQSNGELYIDGPNNNQIIAGIEENGVQKTYWSSNNSGTITITRFDYLNGIRSGIFNVTLYNKDNPTEIIQVTDGRFDINVATLNQ